MNGLLRKLALLVIALGLSTAMVACNTAEGVGQDIERAGEGVQDVVD